MIGFSPINFRCLGMMQDVPPVGWAEQALFRGNLSLKE